MQSDCIILGAGACGLAAACALGEAGLRVTLAEKLDRVGKKLLATGNGRCNLSNEDMNPAYYGAAAPFVQKVYERTPPHEVLAFFSRLGLMTASEEGRIYPRTMTAASVLDVLRAGIDRENISLRTCCEAVSLLPSRRGGWSVQLSSGEGLFAPNVLLCMGGSAAPGMGTDGSGTRMLHTLGHRITPLVPALVQLKCDHSALRSLKGIRTRAALTLDIDGSAAASETGELLFADYGVSGVCVFQLSALASRALAQKRAVRLVIHLLPELKDSTHAWLDARISLFDGATLGALFTGVFPRLLAQAVIREARLAPDAPCNALSPTERGTLVQAISAFSMPVTGTQDFAHAQVTAGGLSLDEVDPYTLRSSIFDGLYVGGEALDVDGPCGGYNLHFAFACGLTAAKAIAPISP